MWTDTVIHTQIWLTDKVGNRFNFQYIESFSIDEWYPPGGKDRVFQVRANSVSGKIYLLAEKNNRKECEKFIDEIFEEVNKRGSK